MNKWAIEEGQPGLGYIFFKDGKGSGPIAKNIGDEKTELIKNKYSLDDGDSIFFVCGIPNNFLDFISKARVKIGNELGLIKKDTFEFCWIVDFPMFEYNEELKKIDFSHNPFSMPQGGLEVLNNADPLEIKAFQYDIVCNGVELSSGAIRNHRQDILLKAFELFLGLRLGHPGCCLRCLLEALKSLLPGQLFQFETSVEPHQPLRYPPPYP